MAPPPAATIAASREYASRTVASCCSGRTLRPGLGLASAVDVHRLALIRIAAIVALPFALPFVVIGFALLHFSGMFVPGLQGTYPLLVLAYVAISFPFASTPPFM